MMTYSITACIKTILAKTAVFCKIRHIRAVYLKFAHSELV